MFVSVVSNHSAVVGIYMMIHYHLYRILQVKVHWSSDHRFKWLLCSFSVNHATWDSLQILQAGAGIVSDCFHISLFFIHLSYRLTQYNITCLKKMWLSDPGARSIFIQVNEHLASHSAVVLYIIVLNPW